MSFDVAAFQTMYRAMAPNDLVMVDLLVSDNANGYVEHVDVRAYISGYRPQDIVENSSLRANDTRCIVLAEDLPPGLRALSQRDRIRLQSDGKEYAVIQWDTKTRRVGSTLIAVEGQLRG